MSDYGNPPQDPNAQPNPYGQQPDPNANPYGQPPAYGAQGYGAATTGFDYAGWPKRVGAYLVDGILTSLAAIPAWIGYGILAGSAETTTDPNTGLTTTTMNGGAGSTILILIGLLTGLGFFIWNTCLKGGKTGYSIGKGVLGIKLVKADTGQPIGAGMAFVRYIAHILDSIPCYIGYLWPLWDSKRQTFADKVLGTVVVNQPKG